MLALAWWNWALIIAAVGILAVAIVLKKRKS